MNSEKTGEFIAELRKKQGLTQQGLADKLNVTSKAISRWETGRGYPDIEMLPRLAEALSVSINEILNGEAIAQEDAVVVSERNITYVCQNVAYTKKRNRKSLLIVAIVIAIIIISVAIRIGISAFLFFKEIKGSENCVIAEDYSYITYYDEKYVPFDTDDYLCSVGEELTHEAQVENTGVLGKLLFAEMIYAIRGVPDSSLIYLQSECDTDYFVKESKLSYYEDIIENFNVEYIYADIEQMDSNTKELLLDEELIEALTNSTELPHEKLNFNFDYSMREEWVSVKAYEENHIFYEYIGDILYKNNEYYWFTYEYDSRDRCCVYPIDNKYYEKLDKIFSYIGK